MKTITICDKEYEIGCNAFTRFQYKKIFGNGIFADINILNKFSTQQEELRKKLKESNVSEDKIEQQVNMLMMDSLDDFIDVIEKMAYIEIYTVNNKIGSFEEWIKGIDKIDLSADWVSEVTELAVSSFC